VWRTRPGKERILRVGRDEVECWDETAHGLRLSARESIAQATDRVQALTRAASEVLSHGSEQPSSSVAAVLESAWLPMMLVPLGAALWSRRQAEQLLRHRLREVHDLAAGYELHLEHRAGGSHALGYALPRQTRDAIRAAVESCGSRVASLQPALTWGWRVLSRRGYAVRDGWLAWAEHDRTLVVRLHRGQVSALNPGAPVAADAQQARGCVEVEALRHGLAVDDASVTLAVWPGRRMDEGDAA
jgi:hypothetical protein